MVCVLECSSYVHKQKVNKSEFWSILVVFNFFSCVWIRKHGEMELWHRLALEDENELILGFLKINFVEDKYVFLKMKMKLIK